MLSPRLTLTKIDDCSGRNLYQQHLLFTITVSLNQINKCEAISVNVSLKKKKKKLVSIHNGTGL